MRFTLNEYVSSKNRFEIVFDNPKFFKEIIKNIESILDKIGSKEMPLNTGNTILRLIFDHFNYEIVKMDCVTIGPLSKKDLPRGHWKHLTEQEISNLMML